MTAGDIDLFSPVSVGRVSQVIVDQVRLLLRQGRLVPGDRLPSERELCERFGVEQGRPCARRCGCWRPAA